MSVNKAIIVGNLDKDPEVRYSQGGTAIANLSIATTHRAKGPDGQWNEETEWHRVTLFGKTAEVAGQYLTKGRPVYIEGRIQTRKWQDQSGQDRYTTEIIAENMQMLGGRGDGAVTNEGTSGPQNHAPQNQQPRKQAPQQNYQADTSGMGNMDDDIPFAPLLARNAYVI